MRFCLVILKKDLNNAFSTLKPVLEQQISFQHLLTVKEIAYEEVTKNILEAH